MGWGRMLLLGNVGQQLDIADTEQAIAQLAEQLRRSERVDRDLVQRVERLGAENAELKLYLAAVVRLLVSKGVVSHGDLKTIVDAIDRSDGRADGKFTGDISSA